MDLQADVKCPGCSRMLKIPVKTMRPGSKHHCQCGAEISLTGDDGSKVQKAMDDLERTMKNFGKR